LFLGQATYLGGRHLNGFMLSAEIIEAKVNCLHSNMVLFRLAMGGSQASEPLQV
jgi:hypothetical protein